jgi:hypothetical protein
MDRAARTGALSGNAAPCPGVALLPAEDPVLALSSRHLDSCARVTRPPALLAERPAPLSPKLIPEEWHPPVLTSSNPLSTRHQRFACARLSQSYLAGKFGTPYVSNRWAIDKAKGKSVPTFLFLNKSSVSREKERIECAELATTYPSRSPRASAP